MLPCKLILFEGIPGSGKSTMAQTLQRYLRRAGISARWWYEEDVHHPVYVVHSLASLRQVLDELTSGQYHAVVARALEQWQRFADAVHAAEGVVLLDGCLFGYLTWSLFPLVVPDADIHAYLAAVERIVTPIAPCLIYLYQQDIAASFRRVFASRGPDIERAYIGSVEESPYGRQHGLRGFDGLVRYWTDYRAFTDTAFAGIAWPRLSIDTTEGAWHAYEGRALDFLDLSPAADDAPGVPTDLGRFVGSYRSLYGTPAIPCSVQLEDGSLLVDGLPEVWPRTRLVPTAPGVFEVASLPIEIRFSEDASGATDTMHVTGPELLGGSVANAFRKEGAGDMSPQP